jgi:hypothetical protein
MWSPKMKRTLGNSSGNHSVTQNVLFLPNGVGDTPCHPSVGTVVRSILSSLQGLPQESGALDKNRRPATL